MTTYAAPYSWESLEKDCQIAFGCDDYQVAYVKNRKDLKAQRKLEYERSRISQINQAVQQALKENPRGDTEILTGSIIAILLPWVLPFLRQWIIGTFEKLVINWILNRLETN